MSSMRAAAALVFLCAIATAAAAQDDHFPQGRIVGSVEIPALHGAINRGAPEPAHLKPVTLYVEPKAGSRAAAVLRTSKDVVSIEHGYEQLSAGVLETRSEGGHRWYRVQFQLGNWHGNGWLAPRDAGKYRPLSRMLLEGLAFLSEAWDGALYDAPRAGARRRAVGRTRERPDVRVIATSGGGPQLWLRVEIVDHGFCEDPHTPPSVVAAGWIPLYSRDGRVTAWHYSRGC